MTQAHGKPPDRGVTDAVREAVDRTLQATAGSAASTRERAAKLLDEVSRRGREARDDVTRAGQLTGAEVARRGQEAGAGLARRLELLEQRLAEVEDSLRREAEPGAPPAPGPAEAGARGDDEGN